ncbi:hypothetical protein [Lysinibacillus fusiformis]|uniref:hypothetical protein n=1 Tax=Lysinibacillus fusiformis TaxID=28031 RepID=UPI00148BE6F5|nr:hypothetical protein [Lysinibacillus fusiformis]NOG28485.1 hypothetical protein [Lysinibacillus fusiformis]
MKKIITSTFASLMILAGSTVTTVKAESNEINDAISPEWIAEDIIITPSWFEEYSISLKSSTLNSNQYVFVHNNGQELSQSDVSSMIEGSIEIEPDENNQQANLVGIGYYTVDGKVQTDFYFSNIENTPIKDIRKYAIEIANEEYSQTNGFRTNNLTDVVVSPYAYGDTYHWLIYSNQEKDAYGSYLVAGFIDSSVEYTKNGTATIGGKKVSVWDVKASNQSKPQNSYQTRQIASRHTVEPYVPDQKLLSYGPTTTTTGSNFSVSLTNGFPTISWNFSRESVDVIDNSSLSAGYGKWTFDFPLGTKAAKGSFLMQPGIRVSNASGMVKFQHSHQGYFYKNLSYQGIGVTGLVTRELPDL